MQLTLRVLVPSAFRFWPTRHSHPRIGAEWVVVAAFLASAVLLFGFVARHASRVPFHDEYANIVVLLNPIGNPSAYWAQHNEHRIPLPKLVYVVAVRLAGFDFRAPLYVDAALLVVVTGALLLVARRVRGRTAFSDAFIPISVLGLGGWENLVWAFQVQFVLSTVLALGLLCLFAVPGFSASAGRVLGAGVLLVLLPLCGANGLALVPAVAIGMLYIAWRNVASGERSLFLPGVIAAAAVVGAASVFTAYFIGLNQVGHHATTRDVGAVVSGAINFLGLALGPVTHLMHAPGYDRPTIFGVAVTALVLATLVRLLAVARDPAERPRAVLLGCTLGGFLCLTAGLAYGRAGLGNILGPSRYVTLAMPVGVVAYLCWVAVGGPVWGRRVPAVLAIVAAAVLIPTVVYANLRAGEHAARVRKVEYAIRAGVPIGFITDGNKYVYPGDATDFRLWARFLRDAGVRPFDAIAPDPQMRAVAVPVRVSRAEHVEELEGTYVVTGSMGTLALALPRRETVYALALTYEATKSPHPFGSMVSWDRDGRAPPAPGYGILDQLMPTTHPVTTRLLVDREIDTLRIDLAGCGSSIRVHGLAVLYRQD